MYSGSVAKQALRAALEPAGWGAVKGNGMAFGHPVALNPGAVLRPKKKIKNYLTSLLSTWSF